MNNFLEPSQCLVYLETGGNVSEVNGYTYIARNIRSFYDQDRLWYEVRLETLADGKPMRARNAIFVTEDRVVSNRSYITIEPKHFYHYTNDGIEATNFVFKSDSTNPLISTSRTALGSGIFGTRTVNYNSGQKPYLIKLAHGYDVQDAEHGDAITMASITTNAYLDSILAILADESGSELLDIVNTISSNNYDHLVILWNIVFYRTNDSITHEQLGELLAQYIYEYQQPGQVNTLFDSITDTAVAELPINSIMRSMGYDGLLAADPYNNGWDRGCVSYDYGSAVNILGTVRKDDLSFISQ